MSKGFILHFITKVLRFHRIFYSVHYKCPACRGGSDSYFPRWICEMLADKMADKITDCFLLGDNWRAG